MKLKVLPEGTKTNTFLVRLFCNNEYFGDCSWGLMEVTSELTKKLEKAKILLEMSVGRIDSLYQIVMWDNGSIIPLPTAIEEKLGIDEEIDLDNECMPIKSLTKSEKEKLKNLLNDDVYIRTETNQVSVDEYGVKFNCYAKYYENTELYSSTLDYKDFNL